MDKIYDDKYCVKYILFSYNSVYECDISINVSVVNNFWYGISAAHSGEDL
jgi:hypothetical protein